MKNILFGVLALVVILTSSCKVSKDTGPIFNGKTTSTIKVPAGFTWQNSRNLNFTVNLTDTRFASSVYLISIFDGNPALGGHLLAKGSVTTKSAFTAKVYTSNLVKAIYIVKTAPDNSQSAETVQVGTSAVIASLGM